QLDERAQCVPGLLRQHRFPPPTVFLRAWRARKAGGARKVALLQGRARTDARGRGGAGCFSLRGNPMNPSLRQTGRKRRLTRGGAANRYPPPARGRGETKRSTEPQALEKRNE